MKKPLDDDLFKDSVMTFGEHLEELRRCLFKAVIGLLIGVIIGLFFANSVVRVIESPLEKALQRFYLLKAEDELLAADPDAEQDSLVLIQERGMIFDRVSIEPRAVLDGLANDYPSTFSSATLPTASVATSELVDPVELAKELVADQPPASAVWSKLTADEQRDIRELSEMEQATPESKAKLAAALSRLLPSRKLFDAETVDSLGLSSSLQEQFKRINEISDGDVQRLNRRLLRVSFPAMIAPEQPMLQEILVWKNVANDPRTTSQSLSVQEGFVIWLKAALILGLVISSPWVFFQIWSFVAAGLYPHEKKYVHVFMPFSLFLFLAGAAIAFFWVFEPVLEFFFGFNRSLGIDPDPRISEWLSFFMFLPIGFGIAFQLPLVMLFLERIGVMSVASYLKQWRISVLVIFVLAAVLTPGDPYSMLFLGVPLVVLYFGGVLICHWWPNQRNQ